jgi:hypothetical protein
MKLGVVKAVIHTVASNSALLSTLYGPIRVKFGVRDAHDYYYYYLLT